MSHPVDQQAPPLPALHQGELDAAGIDTLLADITSLGRVLEVQVKQGPMRRAQTDAVELADARRMLADGTASALQIRYEFEGRVWIDTLIATTSGARIVRMAAPPVLQGR